MNITPGIAEVYNEIFYFYQVARTNAKRQLYE